MSNSPDSKSESVKDWLKNLSQESWQLELLVSAFTIFLLIAGQEQYNNFYQRIPFNYDLQSPIFGLVYIFLGMISLSLRVLLFCLVSHLLLRGFWIGTIGLRSVQDHIVWTRLNYSQYFSEKIKKKVYSLDDLVIQMDEICSVIFSFSFLLISVLLSFGLTIVVGGVLAVLFQALTDYLNAPYSTIISNITNILLLIYSLAAVIYMIDFFSLGFFKKYNRLSRIYYPVYKIFGFITVAAVSRPIYYHLISRFTKNKIRIVYFVVLALFIVSSLISVNHKVFFSSGNAEHYLSSGFYEESLNTDNDLIANVSVPSKEINGNYVPLFIRYNPNDNDLLSQNCSEFKDLEPEFMNWNIGFRTSNTGVEVRTSENSESSDGKSQQKLDCIGSIYKVSINGSQIVNPKFLFHNHPLTNQAGILLMISSNKFLDGENELLVEKISEGDSKEFKSFALIRLWK